MNEDVSSNLCNSYTGFADVKCIICGASLKESHVALFMHSLQFP